MFDVNQGQFFEDDTIGALSGQFDMNSGDHVLWEGDSRDLCAGMSDGSVDLVVTSPPYGIGKTYEDRLDPSSYLREARWVVTETARLVRDGGSVCWQVGNHVHDGQLVPLDVLYFPLFTDAGFVLRNRIVWTFRHGLHASRRFSGRYEMMLWFTKGDGYTFNLDDVRVPSRYPGKKHHKGVNRGQLSGNPLGKNPSDVWQVMTEEWETGWWDIPNVKHNHPEKTSHPCQYPIEVAQRCILAVTNPGDVVLDPFGGAGTTLLAAAMTGRRGVTAEQDPEFCQIIRDRFRLLQRGELPYRQIGTVIPEPETTPISTAQDTMFDDD